MPFRRRLALTALVLALGATLAVAGPGAVFVYGGDVVLLRKLQSEATAEVPALRDAVNAYLLAVDAYAPAWERCLQKLVHWSTYSNGGFLRHLRELEDKGLVERDRAQRYRITALGLESLRVFGGVSPPLGPNGAR